MASSRLLWVVPSRDSDGWDVIRPGTREVVGHGADEADAAAEATALLPDGGGIQVLDRDGFIVGRHPVPLPPESPRAVLVKVGVRLLAMALVVLVVRLLFPSVVTLVGPALGFAALAVLSGVRRFRAARRAQADRLRLTARPRSGPGSGSGSGAR